MQNSAEIYINHYFNYYLKFLINYDFLNQDSESLTQHILNKPILINKPSTYVDTNFSGPSFDFTGMYTYFDDGYTIVDSANHHNLIIPDDYNYKSLLTQFKNSFYKQDCFFESIHKFPRLCIDRKYSKFINRLGNNSNRLGIGLNNTIVGRNFITRIPFEGNADLIYLIFKQYPVNNVYISPYLTSMLNTALQKLAILSDMNQQCYKQAEIEIIISLSNTEDEADENLIRKIQAQTLFIIDHLRNNLSRLELYFNKIKDQTLNLILTRLNELKDEHKKSEEEIKLIAIKKEAYNKLINDF